MGHKHLHFIFFGGGGCRGEIVCMEKFFKAENFFVFVGIGFNIAIVDSF